MTERAVMPDVEIRPARASDAAAFLEFWRGIVAEQRFVRTEVVDAPVRAYRRRFRRRKDDGEEPVGAQDPDAAKPKVGRGRPPRGRGRSAPR